MQLGTLPALFDSFAHTAAPVVVTGFWQGLAVALALALCLRFAPRIAAAHRFSLWIAGFIAVAALPLAPFIFQIFGPTSGSAAFADSTTTSSHALLQLDSRWTLAIAVLWLIASAARAVDLVIHSLRLRRFWLAATPVDTPALPECARTFRVCSTQLLDRPSVIGFFAPRVLIPDWLFPRLTPGELQQIVLHESEHLRRRDDWTNLFQKLSLVLFPLNPALWWMDRQLAKEREMACDEAVVRFTQAPRAYAACLTSLAERGLSHRAEALSLGAWQRRSELVHRVHSILHRSSLMHPVAARMLLGTVGCGLLVISFGLARCPQFVAFVSPERTIANTIANSRMAAQLGDAVYPTNPRREILTSGFHVVQAKAEMPTAPIAKPFAGRARSQESTLKTPAVGELRAQSSEPGVSAHAARALNARQSVSPDSNAPQQWVVFTTWEQIETSAPGAQTAADYDTQPATDEQPSSKTAVNSSAKSEEQADKPATNLVERHSAFTQLILRVVPPNSRSGSQSTQPAAIPIGDGWFVIQL